MSLFEKDKNIVFSFNKEEFTNVRLFLLPYCIGTGELLRGFLKLLLKRDQRAISVLDAVLQETVKFDCKKSKVGKVITSPEKNVDKFGEKEKITNKYDIDLLYKLIGSGEKS